MRTVTLADTGRRTTQLGYGCSSLMGAMGRSASLAMLEAAYESGIRHFDVAPMYGYGDAEACLGEFLKSHPEGATVTTKFGIAPPRRRGLLRLARRAVGPVLRVVPSLKQRLARTATAVLRPAAALPLTPAAARASLEESLRALRSECLDVLLLHEVSVEQLGSEELLRFLEDSVREGKLRSFGIGSERRRVSALITERSAYCRIVQHEWSVLDRPEPARDGRFHIHHRSLTENFHALTEGLRRAPEVCRRWSAQTGCDLASREMLAALMLKAALEVYPDFVLLVSSKNPAHLRANVRTAEDTSLRDAALKLAALVQGEGVPGAGAAISRTKGAAC